MSVNPSLIVILGKLGSDELIQKAGEGLSPASVMVKKIDWNIDQSPDEEKLVNQIVSANPSVVCMGSNIPQDVALKLTSRIFSNSPTIEVIFVGEPSAALWAQISRVGARDIIDPTSSDEEVFSAIGAALERVRNLQSHVQASSSKESRLGRVIVILSPKGGSGKTTVSVNVAEAIAHHAPERTVVIDLDCQFGDVATALGLEPERTLTDLGALTELDSTALKLFLTRTKSNNLFVLPSSGTPEEADLIDEATATRILRIARSDFDYVIVDTAAGIDERSLAAINEATDLLFVASMDVTSIRNLMKELDLLEKLGPSLQHRHFVLNRVDAASGLNPKDIVEAIGLPISHTIDASPQVVQNSNAGKTVVLSEPKSAVAKQFREIAGSFLAEDDREKRKTRAFWRSEK